MHMVNHHLPFLNYENSSWIATRRHNLLRKPRIALWADNCVQNTLIIIHKTNHESFQLGSDWRHLLPACIAVPLPVVVSGMVPWRLSAPTLLLPPPLAEAKVVEALVKRHVQVGCIHPHAVHLKVENGGIHPSLTFQHNPTFIIRTRMKRRFQTGLDWPLRAGAAWRM